MSPARSRRTPVPHRRSRADIVRAAGAGAAIIVLTALLVWLMRPGRAGTLGTGGMMNRQPRASGLVLATILVAAGVAWWILRKSRRARGHEKVALPIAMGVVLVAAVIAGIAWPGGLLRHYFVAPEVPPITTTTAPATVTSSTGATSSSSTPTTGPTTAPTTAISTTTSP